MLSEAQHLPGPPHYANPQRECFPESPPLQSLTLTEASNLTLKGPDSEVTGQAVMENRTLEPGYLGVNLSCSTQPAVCCRAAALSSTLVFPSVKWGQEEFLLPQSCVYLCVCVHAHTLSCVRIFVTSQTAACQGSFVQGNFLGKNTRVGCHFLLQGIFPTQGSNLSPLGLPALVGRFFTIVQPGVGLW